MNIEIISAGAGSGKTYTLTERMVELLKGGLKPAGLLATTFTKKAAAELQERVRHGLLAAQMPEAANELGEAMIGTVHSIGARLLQRFAFEAGVSPLVEIIAENDAQRLFNESLAQVLSESRIEQMNLLADRLGLSKKSFGDPFDWRRDLRELTEVARANNFSKEVLETSKIRSWERFEQLLPPAQATDALTWNNRLISAIDQTVAALEANESDGTKVTQDAIENLKLLQNQLKFRGELYWYEWAKIAKINVGAKSRELMEPLQQLARSHDEHRQFQDDIKAYIYLSFEIAADALQEFEWYKKKRGLIDYTDMETYVSKLLRQPSVRSTLQQEIELLLVDEFQDTSPIQLDIFLQLSQLAKQSIWVGDPKQSIYGFRGAEPALMQAIIEASGGVKPGNILDRSWRSRPDLVYAVNAIFERAFTRLPKAQIVLEPAFKPEAELDALGPALIHWHFRSELDERKVPGGAWLDHCVADQIRLLLEQKPNIYINKRSHYRPLQPGDIAILCRNNSGCQNMAVALHRAGIQASISRAGLLETREAKLALACLKYLLTSSDALSAAEILMLTGAMDLETLANDRLEYLYQQQSAPGGARWAADNPHLRLLQELRPRTADLSASEILDLVLAELDLRRIVAEFGQTDQAFDNLDRLRRYALDYESACKRLHSAATLGGFLLWINQLAEQGQDMQGFGASESAVNVLTYHRSKGLEYPVTICMNLDQALKEQIWGINLVSELEKPDLNHILGNRWLRFWVNPYSDQLGRTRLEETIRQTPEWNTAQQIAREEEARLLYVGLTRARDYLIFPTTPRDTKWLNRVFNHGDESIPTLDPHSSETPFYREGRPLHAQTSILFKPRDFAEAPAPSTAIPYFSERRGKSAFHRAPSLIDPYKEQPEGFEAQWAQPVAWGSWIEFKGEYPPELTKALKALLTVPFAATPAEVREALVARQLLVRGLQQVVSNAAILRQWEAFHLFLERQLGAVDLIAQYPVEATVGRRRLTWEADLCSQTGSKHHLLVFAPFAEGMKKWPTIAKNLAPALGWARQAYAQSGRMQPGAWLVFPVEGQACELQ